MLGKVYGSVFLTNREPARKHGHQRTKDRNGLGAAVVPFNTRGSTFKCNMLAFYTKAIQDIPQIYRYLTYQN